MQGPFVHRIAHLEKKAGFWPAVSILMDLKNWIPAFEG